MSTKSQELADRLRKHFSGPMKAEQVDFLRDVQGFIEFAIRNGLSFPIIVSTLGHDVNEIAREGFELDKVKPKVAGYGKINEEDFGHAETVE
jgi:hypothetical protein